MEVTLVLDQYEYIVQSLDSINQALTNIVYIAVAFLVWKVISVIYRLFNDILR